MSGLSNNIIVAMSQNFFKKLNTLPRKIRKKVNDTIHKFRSNPTGSGLNFETINNATDPNFRSIRVTQDYRIIVNKPEQGNVYLFCWVDKHDEAYAWATKRRCKVHPRTGGVQIFVDEEISEVRTQPQHNFQSQVEDKVVETPLFAEYSDEQLLQLGTPPEQVSLIRTVLNHKDLVLIQERIPEEVYEALQYLDDIDFKEVLESLQIDVKKEQQEDYDTEDIAGALERASSKRSFWVADNEKQLQEMLDAPLEQWRIFLHPNQRKYVEKDLNGPTRVLGGAGTGKTVVAMHRAVYLAKNVFTRQEERILFTTFTKNLAQDIKSAIEGLGEPEETSRIEVLHLHGWVQQFLKKQKYQYKIAYFGDKSGVGLDELWKQALLKTTDLVFSPQFYREEWEQVVQYHGIDSYVTYSRVKRTGRGSRLSRKQRFAIWKVFEEYRNLLEENGIREHIDALRDARILLNENPHLKPFKSIIVDEAQDLSPEAYRLIRALAPKGKNDLFIVGDGHQRIYKYKVTLSHCDINIKGRGYRLRLNYRTTDEIRSFAVGILKGLSIDDLDGGQDDLSGYTSLLHGDRPIVERFSSLTEEVQFLEEVLQDEDYLLSKTCLVARTQSSLNRYIKALGELGVKTSQIKRSASIKSDNLRVATMHRVKGLEFDRVLVVGLNQTDMPLHRAIDEADDELAKQAAETRERCLLYVALTRAKKQAFLTVSGVPSPLLG